MLVGRVARSNQESAASVSPVVVHPRATFAARLRADSILNMSSRSLHFSARETHTRMQMGWGLPAGVMASVRSPGPFVFWCRVNSTRPSKPTLSCLRPPLQKNFCFNTSKARLACCGLTTGKPAGRTSRFARPPIFWPAVQVRHRYHQNKRLGFPQLVNDTVETLARDSAANTRRSVGSRRGRARCATGCFRPPPRTRVPALVAAHHKTPPRHRARPMRGRGSGTSLGLVLRENVLSRD